MKSKKNSKALPDLERERAKLLKTMSGSIHPDVLLGIQTAIGSIKAVEALKITVSHEGAKNANDKRHSN